MKFYVIATVTGFWYEKTCDFIFIEKAFKTEEEAEQYAREHEAELKKPDPYEEPCDYKKYQILPVTIED